MTESNQNQVGMTDKQQERDVLVKQGASPSRHHDTHTLNCNGPSERGKVRPSELNKRNYYAITNFVTASDLRKREPALARLKPNDEELEAMIDKAFIDFCSQYKEEQGRVPSTTAPIYLLEGEDTTENKVVRVTIDDYKKRVINRFVIEKEITMNEGTNKILLRGSTDGVRYKLIREILINNSELQSFIFYVPYPYLECEIVKDEELDINLTCYITESPYDTLIEFLALSYSFESLIKTNDIYIVKSDRYKTLYNERFMKLNPEHTNGLYAICEIIDILK